MKETYTDSEGVLRYKVGCRQVKLTKVTDQMLMKIRDNSDNPVYKTAPPAVMQLFKEEFPNTGTNTILQMMALMAGDVVKVNSRGNKYFLMLPEEDYILNRINSKIKAANRITRAHNKATMAEARRKFAEFTGIDLGKLSSKW